MNKRICIFTFANGTKVRAAVSSFDHAGDAYAYDHMFEQAKNVFEEVGNLDWWHEAKGRGGLVAFEIGDYIAA